MALATLQRLISDPSEEVEEVDTEVPYREFLRANRGAFAALMITVVVAFPLIMYLGREQWFFLDEWDFLANRDGGDFGDLMKFHNDHPSTIPIISYRLVWQFVGLRQYVPYQALAVLAHLLSAIVLWVLITRRTTVRPWTATLVTVPYILLGTGWQNIVWAFQIGLVGSMVFGFSQLLVATRRGPLGRHDTFGVALGVLAIGCSGVGVTTTAIAGLGALIARGWKPALVHTVPVAVLYLVWVASFDSDGVNPTAELTTDMVPFVRLSYQEVFHDLAWFTPVAWLVAVLLIGGLVVAWRSLDLAEWRTRAAVPVAMAVGGLGFITITAWGRAAFFGIHFGASSRYTHILVASLVPALAVAADATMRRWRVLVVPVVVLLLAGVPYNVREFQDRTREPLVLVGETELIHAFARQVAADPSIPDATRPLLDRAEHLTVGWLRDVIAHDDINLRSQFDQRATELAAFRLALGTERIPMDDALDCPQLTEPVLKEVQPGDEITVGLGTVIVRLNEEPPRPTPFNATLTSFRDGVVLRIREPMTLTITPNVHAFGPLVCS